MSSADLNCPFKYTIGEATNIIAFPLVDRMMRRAFTVIPKGWDIPYLAGYSGDGRSIFIDQDIEPWVYKGAARPTSPFLVLHEHVEKSVADAVREAEGRDLERLLMLLRMIARDDKLYFHCHGVATCVEEYSVRNQYGEDGLAAYNKFMGTQVKRAEDERIRRVPIVLDMLPYQGKDPRDVRLRRVMEERMAA